MVKDTVSKKEQTLLDIYASCKESGDFNFDNNKVKEACDKTGFGNPYDVTKIDNSNLLPEEIRKAGYCVVHLGKGRHSFMNIAKSWYHKFESIDKDDQKDWSYKPSILNHTDTSESNVISFAYNQRIIQEFLYGDITASPKIYMSRRTKITTPYRVGEKVINAKEVQIEMDATFEHEGEVTVLEAKNGFPEDFSVYQLFLPCLDYHKKSIPGVTSIKGCFLLKDKKENVVRLYLYAFSDANDVESIQLVKNAEYNLTVREK